MDHNMHNVQICPFSLDPSHRGVESTSRKSVILSVCHHFEISNIGPLYQPRIMSYYIFEELVFKDFKYDIFISC